MKHTITLEQSHLSISAGIKISRVLMLVKMLLVVPFGITLSTLVLYMGHQLQLSDSASVAITASFIGCSGLARVIAGWLGDSLIKNVDLLAISALLLSTGSLLLILPSTFYLAISCIAIGSGLLVAVNCLITEIFRDDESQREVAFIRNYSGMNVGYILSFALSGYYELHHQYNNLFLYAGLISFSALLIALINRGILSTSKPASIKPSYNIYTLYGFTIIGITIFSAYWIIKSAAITNTLILISTVAFLLWTIIFAVKQPSKSARNKVYSYIMLAIPVLIFWTIYNLSPMALMLFIEKKVNRQYFRYEIAPQWAQLIITVVVIIGGPALCSLFDYMRKKGISVTPPRQFAVGLILIGFSLAIIPIGMVLAGTNNLVNFNWIIASFTLQGTAELLIAPVGFALIAKYIPHQSQGLMMGNWMILISLGAILSGYLSKYILNDYTLTFTILGVITILLGILTFLLIPFALEKLHQESLSQ